MATINRPFLPSSGQSFCIAAIFEKRVEAFADHDAVANAFDEMWNHIDDHLDKMLGLHLVNGLYWRSLFLASQSHPWLKQIPNSVLGPKNLEAYRIQIAQKEKVEAVSASASIFSAFEKMLVVLVGYSLSDHLIIEIIKRTLGGVLSDNFLLCGHSNDYRSFCLWLGTTAPTCL